ncbi:MAG: ribosomal protein S21 [Candidatus Azotimanducaceae bacterium]|jgi:ribosomal protein S21
MLYFCPHMALNVQVEKNQNESSANVIRRFTKRMQNAGIVRKIRGIRYHARTKSKNVQKETRLKKLGRKDEYEKLHKLGKIQDNRR